MKQHQGFNKAISGFAKTNEIFANIAESKGRLRAQALVDLAVSSIGDSDGYGVILKGNKILSDPQDLTDNQIKTIRSGKHSDKFIDISFGKKYTARLATTKVINAEHKKSIAAQLERFPFESKFKRNSMVLVAMLLTLTLLPITESVTTDATVIGEQGYQISASRNGMVEEILSFHGYVSAGSRVARIKNNDDLDIKDLQTELDKVVGQIRSFSANGQESINQLYLQEKKLNLQIQRIQKESNDKYISTPSEGLIEWMPNLLGSFVQKGEKIGSVNPELQRNVSVLISTSDWINLKIGDKAVFINGRDFEPTTGNVISLPTKITMVEGLPKYAINVALKSELETGTTGTVSIKGSKTRLIYWLTRKQSAWIKALLMS